MKKTIFCCTLSLMTFLCTACVNSNGIQSTVYGLIGEGAGSDNYVTKTFEVSPFEAIDYGGTFDVTFTQEKGTPKVELCAPDDVIDFVAIYSKGNTLYVELKKEKDMNMRGGNKDIKLHVFSPKLTAVSLQGAGNLVFDNAISTDRLSLQVSGAANIEGRGLYCGEELHMTVAGAGNVDWEDITVKDLNIDVAGAGDIRMKNARAVSSNISLSGASSLDISGSTRTADFVVAGTGEVLADGFKAEDVMANISGMGEIKCHATKTLKAYSTGWGKISYKGNPKIIGKKKNLHKL